PQRAVTPYRPGFRAAGITVAARKLPSRRTRARTAGTPANECTATNARESTKTVSPLGQPPAVPRIRTVPPARTSVGVNVSELLGPVRSLAPRLDADPIAMQAMRTVQARLRTRRTVRLLGSLERHGLRRRRSGRPRRALRPCRRLDLH